MTLGFWGFPEAFSRGIVNQKEHQCSPRPVIPKFFVAAAASFVQTKPCVERIVHNCQVDLLCLKWGEGLRTLSLLQWSWSQRHFHGTSHAPGTLLENSRLSAPFLLWIREPGPERDANVLKVMHGGEQKSDSPMHPKPAREASGAQFDSRGSPVWKEGGRKCWGVCLHSEGSLHLWNFPGFRKEGVGGSPAYLEVQGSLG